MLCMVKDNESWSSKCRSARGIPKSPAVLIYDAHSDVPLRMLEYEPAPLNLRSVTWHPLGSSLLMVYDDGSYGSRECDHIVIVA